MGGGGGGGGAGIAQWLERRTRDWKVAGSNPCWNGGIIFFSRVDFLCWLLFRYPFHPRVTTVARKKSRSFCQKCRWQVTAKHAYTLRIEPCFGIGHNLSLICQMTSEDIKHQLNNNNNKLSDDMGFSVLRCRDGILGALITTQRLYSYHQVHIIVVMQPCSRCRGRTSSLTVSVMIIVWPNFILWANGGSDCGRCTSVQLRLMVARLLIRPHS